MLEEEILKHAKDEFPRECCGVVIIYNGEERYIPCRNVADVRRESFVIHPEDYAAAEDMGEIIKIVHSHPNKSPNPSEPDLVNIEKTNLPWIIINPITGQMTETKPSGYEAPLVGRKYILGTFDCFTLVQDYYKRELNINIKDFRENGEVENWFEKGKNYVMDYYKDNNFKIVEDLQKHDIVAMSCRSTVVNHLGIYLGDGRILQQVKSKLSSVDIYGNAGYWYQCTKHHFRHVDLF